MVHLLYAVAALTCALVVLILPARTMKALSRKDPLDRAFIELNVWVVVFCLADGLWGVLASDAVMNDGMLRVASFIFHLFASFTPLVWLHFVLTYLGNVRLRRLFVTVAVLLFAGEVLLLLYNISSPLVFYLDSEGAYNSGPMRRYLFYAQYVNYLTMAAVALVKLVGNARNRSGHYAVLAFVAAPIVCGIFQQIYPDAPAYSIGYMLGFCVVYSFVVTGMLEARVAESMQMNSANRAKTTFLNNMSHDIRTPLNAITGFNNIALKSLGKDDAKVRDCLDKIGRSSDALLSIINDILEISRIEAGKLVITRDKGNVLYSFVNIEAMMLELARKSGIDLQFEFGPVQDKFVECDISHCCRVFTNLISNAIKYTRRGGWVRVRCEQTGRAENGVGTYVYTVSDNGIGMSEEFQEHLFEPFSREKSSTVSKIQGTGLGLSLCKDLVTSMGGTISCRSRAGEGSTFTVTLPFRIQEGEEFTDPDAAPEDVSGILEGRTILLVDDNELNREIAAAILGEMGAAVVTAEDGAVAVEKMSAALPGDFDLVLMDVQMPILNGYEATRQIRALGTPASTVPIVAMTANAYSDDIREALASGMNAHLAKPIDLGKLKETLARFL